MSESYDAPEESEQDYPSGGGAPRRRYHGGACLEIEIYQEHNSGDPGKNGIIVNVLI